jgi:hypothetical protein
MSQQGHLRPPLSEGLGRTAAGMPTVRIGFDESCSKPFNNTENKKTKSRRKKTMQEGRQNS